MTLDYPAKFEANLREVWPPERWRDVTVLVAVSGGADSVALLRALAATRDPGEGRLIVGHFNHRLRGPESDADEAFVRALAEQLQLTCAVGQAPHDLTASGGDGIEAAARDARYAFLSQSAAEYGARYLVTAHTVDDQVETVLFNILRGTGLAGLAGIPRLRPLSEATTILRPLLGFTRAEITTYLAALNQEFRHDESNQSTDYTRNRIRLELLPALERNYNPRVREALLRLAQAASTADDLLDQQAQAALDSALRPIPGGVSLQLDRLTCLHPAVLRQTLQLVWEKRRWPLQDMSFEKWELLAATAQQPNYSPQTLPGGIRVESTAQSLRLTRSA